MEPFTILSAEARVPLGPFAIENNLPAREGLTRCPSAFLRVGHRQVIRQLHGCFFSLDCLRSGRRKPEKEPAMRRLIMVSLIALAVVLLLASDAR